MVRIFISGFFLNLWQPFQKNKTHSTYIKMKWNWKLDQPPFVPAEGAAPAATQTPHMVAAVLTSAANLAAGKRLPVKSFSAEDFVVALVDFQWDDPKSGAGVHKVTWRWYKDGKLLSENEAPMNFQTTPWTTKVQRAAGALGAGHFTVTTFVDGAPASSSDFDIYP